jgi:pyruvate,water dikinase
MSEYVVGLDELGRASVSQAGGKGALLGELLARGVSVPRGFCLTTLAYDDFLQISGIGEDAAAAGAMPPGAEALEAASAIHDRVVEAIIPAEVAFDLSTLYRTLGQRPRVAVRPSLAYQDQLRSPVSAHVEAHLNVLGEKDLFQAIRDTWASVWRPEVVAFCHRNGIEHSRLRPAVIMQVMVHPVCSGTIFTADPGTGDRDRLVITASWGMGHTSLGGQATPDTYHVDRDTLELRFKRIVTKEVMVSATGIVPVPKNRRNSVVLKDSVIIDLCKMALGVEEIIEEPAEIEWCALTSGQVMVLEAAPVGEIDLGPAEEEEREGEEWKTRAAVVQKPPVAEAPPGEPPAAEAPAEEAPPSETPPDEPRSVEAPAQEAPPSETPPDEPRSVDAPPDEPEPGEPRSGEPVAHTGDSAKAEPEAPDHEPSEADQESHERTS